MTLCILLCLLEANMEFPANILFEILEAQKKTNDLLEKLIGSGFFYATECGSLRKEGV